MENAAAETKKCPSCHGSKVQSSSIGESYPDELCGLCHGEGEIGASLNAVLPEGLQS